MATPDITLSVTLNDISGSAEGSASTPAKVRITLCGFGLYLPRVSGTAMIARPGPEYYEGPGAGYPLSIKLWGNDQILPNGTYYNIAILDDRGVVIQANNYQFTGSGTFDLSALTPITPSPYAPPIESLAYRACTGAVPGTVYVAPGKVIAVAYNGVFLPSTQYSVASDGVTVTLDFSTAGTDEVYALCIVPS